MVAATDVNFEELYSAGPVCALRAFGKEFAFAGEGPLLVLYNHVKNVRECVRKVFERNKIHGVQLQGNTVAVWGAQSLSVFTLDQYKDPNFEFPEYGVGDWITYVLVTSRGLVEILTAHNLVHTARVIDGALALRSTKSCGWKSILYSGSLHENLETGVVSVLAGTVMNGIILWDLDLCTVNHNLTHHEGSIFCVVPSADGRFLASCSDDRSIKVYDMHTGELLANGWGHGSRIWGLSIYNVGQDSFNVYSASEDLTARVWKFERGNEELHQERIVYGHTGRHVWSVDVQGTLGFTGGADGKVFVVDLAQEQRPGFLRSQWELSDVQVGVEFSKDELFKEYVDFGSGLLAVTTLGKVLVLKKYTQWEFLFEDTTFERFCIAKGFNDSPIVVIGNKFGNVYIMKFDSNGEMVNKRAHDVRPSLSRLQNILLHSSDNTHAIFYESPNPGEPILYNSIDENVSEVESRILNKPAEKVVLNAVTYDTKRDMYIFGCRFATLVFYKVTQSSEPLEPFATLPKIIKGDTISAIEVVADAEKCTIYATNKDSNYYIVEFDDSVNSYTFVQSSRIQRGFLEGIARGPNNDVLLYGFKSDCFFVWNETGQYEIFRETCGGPHRRWAFRSWVKDGQLKYTFVYTRASEVQLVHNGESFGVKTLAGGLYGREIRDVTIVDGFTPKEKVLILGSEDTTLKVATLTNKGELQQYWTFREHVAGLQSVHHANNEYILSSSAREELFVWRLKQCDGRPCMALYAKLPPSSTNPDLRVMNFDTLEVFQKGQLVGFLLLSVYSDSGIKLNYFDLKSKKFTLMVEDWYLKCCIFQSRFVVMEGKVYVLIGSTNGHVALYDVTQRLECEFQIGSTTLELSAERVFSTKTGFDTLFVNQQLHQSSIRALELIWKSAKEVVLVTGGDDNALVVSTLSRNGITVVTVDENAASSTITTISKVDDRHVLVGGVDQNMKLYEVLSPQGDSCLVLRGTKYTTVADTGSSAVTHFSTGERLAFLGGAGASVWKL